MSGMTLIHVDELKDHRRKLREAFDHLDWAGPPRDPEGAETWLVGMKILSNALLEVEREIIATGEDTLA